MPKLPLPPEAEVLRRHTPAVVGLTDDSVLWRVHVTDTRHVVAWDALRHYGPVASGRFDPHEAPPREQGEGIGYLAFAVPTVLAEVYQATRVINPRRGAPYLTGFRPTRVLSLLDLSGDWPISIGASHAINTGRKDHCRAWARALRAAWPAIDGLSYVSAMTGAGCVALFTPARDTFPDRPDFSEPLAHPDLRSTLAAAADSIGYQLL